MSEKKQEKKAVKKSSKPVFPGPPKKLGVLPPQELQALCDVYENSLKRVNQFFEVCDIISNMADEEFYGDPMNDWSVVNVGIKKAIKKLNLLNDKIDIPNVVPDLEKLLSQYSDEDGICDCVDDFAPISAKLNARREALTVENGKLDDYKHQVLDRIEAIKYELKFEQDPTMHRGYLTVK